MKAKVEDIARVAGVSTATVGRVLNDRGSVSDQARERVVAAVQQLGYRQLPAAVSEALQGTLKLLFLVPDRKSAFVKMLIDGIEQAEATLSDVRTEITIRPVALNTGDQMIAELDSVTPDTFQGVAVFAVDAPGVRQALDRLQHRGVQAVTMIADVPGATPHFVGINNVSAGRVAGNLMGRFLPANPGPVAVISSSATLRDHMDRDYGFRQVMAAAFPDVILLPTAESNSDPDRNRALTQAFLAEYPNLGGIYSVGAGNSGILDALSAVDPGRPRPTVVMHELTPEVRTALSRNDIDAVIGQDTAHIARSAVRVLRAQCFDKEIVESQEKIRIEIFLSDNLP